MRVVKIKEQTAKKKEKFKFQDFKNCLEATQLENKIYHLNKWN